MLARGPGRPSRFGDLEAGRHVSTLQHLLKLSHSTDLGEQQKAALELSRLVETTVFPAVSFGPLAHALCRLVPNENRNVAAHSARAIKLLLLDDALRPQAVAAGMPLVLVEALRRWEGEVSCSREILGALQTLCWDKACVLRVVEAGVTTILVDMLAGDSRREDPEEGEGRRSSSIDDEQGFASRGARQRQREAEAVLLAAVTLANILAYSDSVLLTKEEIVLDAARALPALLDLCQGRDKARRCYGVAALANATAHPVLAGKVKELGGLKVLADIEKLQKANLSLGGTQVAECAETAVLRLTGTKDPKVAVRKYKYKWGNKPMMELTFDPVVHRKRLQVCIVLWVLGAIFLFYPLVFSHRAPRGHGGGHHSHTR
uniref:Armadillo repeat-containing protein 8 n=1 Tax=Rhizochromulina marina TaxID=1034831 RepID=A0A7S2S7X2_9STRA|mmetsp:Transcript_26380/g.76918  ORF Transcript_26380/g.76918 Transcript_26380/m.76918 type:complete len:375 (+) Transcript_26380:115-1239(+)